MSIQIIQADYQNATHGRHLCDLLDAYACDPMGGGEPLRPEVRDRLLPALARLPYAFSLLSYLDEEPVGLVNCLESFSTFACAPIVNIHDFMIVAHHRGRGFSQPMLARVEEIARAKGACKITLEVLSDNSAARAAYHRFGFFPYRLSPQSGSAEFWHKTLEH